MASWLKSYALVFLVALLVIVRLSFFSFADPAGADITSNVTSSAPSPAPGSLTNPRGTITTLVLNATQQVPSWKAYVGNVSGRFTLDDADGYTIYDWDYTGTLAGEVYVSRSSSIDWSVVECANSSTISSEEAALNLSSSDPTSINNTFSSTVHQSFYVGSHLIANSTCRSTFTYINSSPQTPSEDADFQEVLLQTGGTLIYTTILEEDLTGYRNTTTYDFQVLVAESPIASAHTYYFYVELGS